MLLRAAAQSDLSAMMEVQHAGALRALTHIFPKDDYPFPRATIQSRWTSEIETPAVDVYIIENDGRIAGFAAVRDNELLHFGTAVETWGTGLAAAAHDKLVERLAATGVKAARLRVFDREPPGSQILREAGLASDGSAQPDVVSPAPRARGVRTRSLNARAPHPTSTLPSATRTITDVPPCPSGR
jgi:hypothetical protein